MKDKSITIQPVPENSGARVRNQFRVPVQVEGEAVLVIGEFRFPVTEISREGIGIRIREDLPFDEDKILENCRLILGPSEFSGLRGKIVHCSFDEKGYWRCGIQWLEMGTREKMQVEKSLGQMKEMALKQNDRNLLPKEEH